MSQLITKKEFADMLGVSTRTIERAARSDPEFPVPVRVIKGGRTVRFDADQVHEYLLRRAVGSVRV